MALTAGFFGMVVSFMDNGGNIATREYMMKSGVATYTAAAIAAAALIPILEAMTQAEIVGYRVFQGFDESAIVFPGVGIQVENRASLTFLLAAEGNKKGNLSIPAPEPTIFVATSGPGANIVNTAETAVENFANQFLGAADFRMSDGEAIQRILEGKRVHIRSSRG